ncbi:MAG: phosphoribosyltransferase family protein [Desulfuromonadales bacterium]|nr:phosphoribosyltransferase family protein [Desulfuromonadales bacterium]
MNHAAKTLLERIRTDGAIDGQVIKVDLFLNHMVDTGLMRLLARELAGRFADRRIDKILTAETSGIMLAQAVAEELDVPFIYAKKKKPLTMVDYYAAASYSFTKQESTTLYVSREVLLPEERLLFIDDFFAKGSTLKAIEEIVDQSHTLLVGKGVIINKGDREDVESILTMADLA